MRFTTRFYQFLAEQLVDEKFQLDNTFKIPPKNTVTGYGYVAVVALSPT